LRERKKKKKKGKKKKGFKAFHLSIFEEGSRGWELLFFFPSIFLSS
jgi:hypothetical protein